LLEAILFKRFDRIGYGTITLDGKLKSFDVAARLPRFRRPRRSLADLPPSRFDYVVH